MKHLIGLELEKIWQRKGTLLPIALILVVNLFLLWYTNLSDGSKPELSSYRAVQMDLRGMTEIQKLEYIENLYQNIENIGVVRNILLYHSWGNAMGNQFAEQEKAEHPGVYEDYYTTFLEGNYLHYTQSFEQEEALITELYQEIKKVSSYSSYLDEVQQQRNNLNRISIFADGENNFSSRNIEKSASDYGRLTGITTEFYPSKGLMSAMQNNISDILLILSVLLIAGNIIYEEKEKGLFYITRTTVRGRCFDMIARLLALGISTLIVTLFIYGTNLIYFSAIAGIGNPFRSIQSAAPLTESCLPICVLACLILCIITKTWILFLIGTLVTLVSILSKHSFMPYLVCFACLLVSLLLYILIPSYSSLNIWKYLNPAGLLNTELLYGGYLNFNCFGYPLSRLTASWIALVLYSLILIGAVIAAFLKCQNWESKKLQLPAILTFRPHHSLLRHESWKLLVMNRAGLVLLIFTLLIGWRCCSVQYRLTPMETYYQNIMLELEGPLTRKKAELVNTEIKRYHTAFSQINHIDALEEQGEISEAAADSMKLPYYNETAFYPAFERVLEQCRRARETGGSILYDTGWLYLLGVKGEQFRVDLLLLTLSILLAFSNTLAMEYQKQSWQLLSATAQGRKQIMQYKILICIGSAALVGLVPWICKIIHINHVYPLHGYFTALNSIPDYFETGLSIPIIFWMLLEILIQILVLCTMTLITLFLSDWARMHLPALSLGGVILLLPQILNIMGLTPAYWFSFLPLYEQCVLIQMKHGFLIGIGYLLAAIGILGFMLWRLKTGACKT